MEEDPEELKEDAIDFNWDFAKYERDGKCKIVRFNPFELEDLKVKLLDLIKVNDYKRIAIDSSSIFGMYKNDEYKTRKALFELTEILKKTKATTIMSAEIPSGSQDMLSRFGIEEFVADGVIALYYLGIGEGVYRNISVKKMRRTDHAHGIFSMNIGKNGIEVTHIKM